MELSEKLKIVQDRINRAKLRSGIKNKVEIVAITKTHPAELLDDVVAAGITTIGENRVQEAEEKFGKTPTASKLTKRLVGHLQSNKINKALNLFDTIDSVDSLKLAQKIGYRAKFENKQRPVLLEINTSGEIAKFGFDPLLSDELLHCFDVKGLNIEGLMTVGPLTTDKKQIRNSFIALRELLENINNQRPTGKKMRELSMGMSGDFEIAVEEGSTMVRLGTVLFGPRGTYK